MGFSNGEGGINHTEQMPPKEVANQHKNEQMKQFFDGAIVNNFLVKNKEKQFKNLDDLNVDLQIFLDSYYKGHNNSGVAGIWAILPRSERSKEKYQSEFSFKEWFTIKDLNFKEYDSKLDFNGKMNGSIQLGYKESEPERTYVVGVEFVPTVRTKD